MCFHTLHWHGAFSERTLVNTPTSLRLIWLELKQPTDLLACLDGTGPGRDPPFQHIYKSFGYLVLQ